MLQLQAIQDGEVDTRWVELFEDLNNDRVKKLNSPAPQRVKVVTNSPSGDADEDHDGQDEDFSNNFNMSA